MKKSFHKYMEKTRIRNSLRVGDLSGEDHLWSSPRPQKQCESITLWCERILRKLLKDISYCISKDGKNNRRGNDAI